jgi:hypothetical protein
MCNATTKNGSKCKRPNSFGDFCHYHRYLDDDFQPGAIENIKPSNIQQNIENSTIQPKFNIHNAFEWHRVIFGIIRLFK